jgi:tRNA pseudouridine38-40 synthase
MKMRTLVLLIEYDGTNFSGWQIQPNARTVQETIEQSLNKLTEQKYNIIGAGRTDAGVHARGQVAHALIDNKFSIPDTKIAIALNSRLPKDIRIRAARIIDRDFHARFDAIAREYSYTISLRESVFTRHFTTYFRYPLDFHKLNETAECFIGKHDFTTFSKLNDSTRSYVCDIEKCFWQEIDGLSYRLSIKADRFVYGMVRCLTGAMLEYAGGRMTLNEIKVALSKRDRSLCPALAAPQGLILEKVYYDESKKSLFSQSF